MYRAYSESDKHYLIIRFYVFKDCSEVSMVMGAFLFPFVLALPMWEAYIHLDANVMVALIIAYTGVGIIVQVTLMQLAKSEQLRRAKMIQSLVDDDGRLLEKYVPRSAAWSRDSLKERYKLHVE